MNLIELDLFVLHIIIFSCLADYQFIEFLSNQDPSSTPIKDLRVEAASFGNYHGYNWRILRQEASMASNIVEERVERKSK